MKKLIADLFNIIQRFKYAAHLFIWYTEEESIMALPENQFKRILKGIYCDFVWFVQQLFYINLCCVHGCVCIFRVISVEFCYGKFVSDYDTSPPSISWSMTN